MSKKKRFYTQKRSARRAAAKKAKMRKLDEYDTKGYNKDLEYLAKLSYIPESTRSWIEVRMYELRASANKYEHKLGELLIKNGIEFIHQAPFVFRPRKIYFCDFYIPSLRTVIEVDGIYHDSPLQTEKDIERDDNFASIGIKVIRISNEETNDTEKLILRLSGVLKLRHPVPVKVEGIARFCLFAICSAT